MLSKISTEPVKTDNYEVGAYSNISNWLQLNASFFYTYSKLGSDLGDFSLLLGSKGV